MESELILLPERADVDMICDQCDREITVGEDYYYDTTVEEIHCENCVKESYNLTV
jgi:hypothetical protein